jgi:methionine synthase II (cobalamin-independent)
VTPRFPARKQALHDELCVLRDGASHLLIVDVMLRVNAGAYSFEAGNVRHEHEWKLWQDVKLPDGKILVPGVVSHATNVVEHPELVCDRILRGTRPLRAALRRARV